MANEKRRDDRCLEVVEKGAKMVMSRQTPEGFVPATLSVDGEGVSPEPDGVATAMFVLMWLRLAEATEEAAYGEAAERALTWALESQFLARRGSGAFGAFFQTKEQREGRWVNNLGSASSSYGILACEEYLRQHGSG
jgi:hypothetical protein